MRPNSFQFPPLRGLIRHPFHSYSFQSSPHSNRIRFNYNPDYLSIDEPEEIQDILKRFTISQGSDHRSLQLYDRHHLARFIRPPRPSISLARDFIDDSLYNPNYGYFFHRVEIWDTDSVDDHQHSIHPAKNLELEQQEDGLELKQRLKILPLKDDHLDSDEKPTQATLPSSSSIDSFHLDQRQIWHTPTELFKPWYAWSIASYIIEHHSKRSQSSQDPPPAHHHLHPLKIYEIGAGNGTLCQGILDYLRDFYPDVYETTSYTTIELSTRLAERQRRTIERSGHQDRARVINQSILGLDRPDTGALPGDPPPPWLPPDEQPCWILGMEVLDNLTRDIIRRDRVSYQPLQSIVITDLDGNFHERFIPITQENNPDLLEYLTLVEDEPPRSHGSQDARHPVSIRNKKRGSLKTQLERIKATYLPFYSNLTDHEFIPTNYLRLMRTLFRWFPNHNLILTDFFKLTNSLNDRKHTSTGAPVVQTRYNGVTVPTSTFLVKPGCFDIFFPTDFDKLIKIYEIARRSSSSFDSRSSPKIDLIDQNRFLLNFLNDHRHRQTIQPTLNRSTIEPSSSSSASSAADKLCPLLNQVDPHVVHSYYQNVKLLTITSASS